VFCNEGRGRQSRGIIIGRSVYHVQMERGIKGVPDSQSGRGLTITSWVGHGDSLDGVPPIQCSHGLVPKEKT